MQAAIDVRRGAGRDHRHRVQLGPPRRLFGCDPDPVRNLQRKGARRPRSGARQDRSGGRGAGAGRARSLPGPGPADEGGPHLGRRHRRGPRGVERRRLPRPGAPARLQPEDPLRRGRRETGGAGRALRDPRRRRHRRRSRRRQPGAGRGVEGQGRPPRFAAARRLPPRRADSAGRLFLQIDRAGRRRGRLRRTVGGAALLSGRRELADAGPARHGGVRPSVADHPSACHGDRAAAGASGDAREGQQGGRPRHPVHLGVARIHPAQRQSAARSAGARARTVAPRCFQLRHS